MAWRTRGIPQRRRFYLIDGNIVVANNNKIISLNRVQDTLLCVTNLLLIKLFSHS